MNTQNNPERNIIAKGQEKRNVLSLISSIVILCAGLCMILCSAYLSGQERYIQVGASDTADRDSSEGQSVAIYTESEYYVIREDEDGYISVYLSDGSFYKRWSVPAYTLPASDRERLRIGIMAKSDTELSCYEEGFCS